MHSEPVINVEGADFDSGLEALALNPSFRPDSPILRLRVRINWQPEDPRAALGALEARLVKLFPSLRDHECRGQEEYHVLRSMNEGRQPREKETETPIEAALALAHLYEHLIIDTVAFISDQPMVSGATAALEGSQSRFDVFVESPDQIAAWLTVGLATNWITALTQAESPNGDGRTKLELVRYLYRIQPDSVEVSELACALDRAPQEIRQNLDWLTQTGVTRQVDYTMNFSGLAYYGLHLHG